MDITSFDDLLRAAKAQPEAQRLLFVFATSSVPEDANPAQKARHQQGTGGELTPVLCVDKRPDDLRDFAQLTAESRHTGKEWQIVFVGAMADHSPWLPDSKDAEEAMKHMMQMIRHGTISSLLAVDASGDPIRFELA